MIRLPAGRKRKVEALGAVDILQLLDFKAFNMGEFSGQKNQLPNS